jgi:uncharacterized protein (TIGR00255 family)
MTGFGQATGAGPRHQISVALRSVNGRFLDIALRLEPEHRELEPGLRRRVEGEVFRGRVEAVVEIRPTTPPAAHVEIHTEVVEALHEALGRLVEQGLLQGELAAGDLLRLPQALEVRLEADHLDNTERHQVDEVLGQALEQLVAARQAEGARLAEILGARLDELAGCVESLEGRAGEVRRALHDNLRRRLEELLGHLPLDPVRLAQEAALLADRADITEELDRLGAHLEHFRDTMAQQGAVGKRLDFLAQEILRELNTVGSKARDAETTRLVLDGKVLAEQIREQIQNVE